MSDLQEDTWKRLFEVDFAQTSLESHKKAFDYGWICAADEAIDYLNRIGQFGLAGQLKDLLYEDWLDEEEVEDE